MGGYFKLKCPSGAVSGWQSRKPYAYREPYACQGQASGVVCAWMFGDPALSLSRRLAARNPMRWSGSESIELTVEDLRKVRQQGQRPIKLKVSSGKKSLTRDFSTIDEA